MTSVVGIGLLAAAVLLAVVAVRQLRRERATELALALELEEGPTALVEDERSLLEGLGDVATVGLERLDAGERLALQLERGRVPLRAGEYVVLVAGATIAAFALLLLLTGEVLIALIAVPITPYAAWQLVAWRVSRRRHRLESQLPDALSLVASSLEAGHSFLRAIQMLGEESDPPLADELDRVLAETQLGDPLVDALERMADRVDLDDLRWVVQAVRIQQQVGGALAELFHTLADFMRAREEVRLETRALTAEARLSAWLLGALPVVVLVVLQVSSPGYLTPILSGGGLFALFLALILATGGVVMIMRMAKVEV